MWLKLAGVKYLWKSEKYSETGKKAKNFSETLISIFIGLIMYIRECVATGAGTRRSSGHHHMHMQNFDRFHYYFSLLESLVKEVNDSSLCQSGKTVTLFHSDLKDMLKTYLGIFPQFFLPILLNQGYWDMLFSTNSRVFIEKLGFEWQNGASFEHSFLAAFRDNYKNLLLLLKNKQ